MTRGARRAQQEWRRGHLEDTGRLRARGGRARHAARVGDDDAALPERAQRLQQLGVRHRAVHLDEPLRDVDVSAPHALKLLERLFAQRGDLGRHHC